MSITAITNGVVLMGGCGLSCALFSAAMIWMILVRVFNYTGHGKGKVKHVDAVDYDRSNLSINQIRPGIFSGEWHNNHHLFPASTRSGFLPYKVNFAWIIIFSMHKLGIVSACHDSKKEFRRRYQLTGNETKRKFIKEKLGLVKTHTK